MTGGPDTFAQSASDRRWLAAAFALGERARGNSGPNPNVGCVLVKDGRVVGRGWTRAGGRPHAEAMALEQAGGLARGAAAYVTLEPCAHESDRGPCCADGFIAAGVARVVGAVTDPDPRTAGKGFARLRAAGIEVVADAAPDHARLSMAGFFTRARLGRPHVTLKLATSLDGQIALANGQSQWITGDRARGHTHMERARADAILVGGGTLRADNPALDVRLAGLESRSPMRIVLTQQAAPEGWARITTPEAIANLPANWLLIEGGAQTAAAFLRAGLVDRLLLYRAPIIIGNGMAALGDIGLSNLSAAHGHWRLTEARMLGPDRMESYESMAQ
jgi:diaminohydroxyphosphoribosylaminopyrimidine deaminase / 5-amino-6-(5-phosphoribosylamino)uracil reductase